jgi:hypothetical protein
LTDRDPARVAALVFFGYFSPLLIRLFYTVLLVASCAAHTAQNGITGHPDWQIKVAYNRGFILVHRISIGHLVKGYPAIYEVNISKPTLGNKLWHLENNRPDIGITLQCLDYGNAIQLGYAYTASPYVEIPLSVKERASRLVMRMSWGATYITKAFDIRSNHKNIAIGSHWNSFVQFRWFWHLPLGPNLRFEPGLTFSHASNGRAQNPNLGLNVVSLNAALNFLIPAKTRPVVTSVDSSARARSRNEIFIYGAWGLNERQINRPNLTTGIVSAAWQRNVRNTHKFSLGLDFFFDENYMRDYEEKFGSYPAGTDRMRVAARIGYSYNIGRISLPLEIGYYVHEKTHPDGPVVTRLGVRYYSSCGLVAHFGMRSHFAVAYNFEYGLGYRWFLSGKKTI